MLGADILAADLLGAIPFESGTVTVDVEDATELHLAPDSLALHLAPDALGLHLVPDP